MRMPIAWALQAVPRLETGIDWLDLGRIGRLDFEPVDERRFPAMRLVREVMRGGDALAIAMNAANEAANEAFREGRLPFTGIVPLVEQVVARTADVRVADLDEVWAIDAEARRKAEEMLHP